MAGKVCVDAYAYYRSCNIVKPRFRPLSGARPAGPAAAERARDQEPHQERAAAQPQERGEGAHGPALHAGGQAGAGAQLAVSGLFGQDGLLGGSRRMNSERFRCGSEGQGLRAFSVARVRYDMLHDLSRKAVLERDEQSMHIFLQKHSLLILIVSPSLSINRCGLFEPSLITERWTRGCYSTFWTASPHGYLAVPKQLLTRAAGPPKP